MADLFARCSNPCCGYINLRLASLIGSYLQLLGDLGLIAYSIERINFVVHAQASDQKTIVDFTFYFILLFYIEFILFLFIVVLLVGIYKKKRSCIRAYLITLFIFLGFATLVVLYFAIRTFVAEVFFPGIILIGLLIYYLVIIVNYYKEIGVNTRTSDALVEAGDNEE